MGLLTIAHIKHQKCAQKQHNIDNNLNRFRHQVCSRKQSYIIKSDYTKYNTIVKYCVYRLRSNCVI